MQKWLQRFALAWNPLESLAGSRRATYPQGIGTPRLSLKQLRIASSLFSFSLATLTRLRMFGTKWKAASLGLPILLFRIDATDPSKNKDISLFLGSHQWYDASSGALAGHLTRLLPDLQRFGVAARGDDKDDPKVTSQSSPITRRDPRHLEDFEDAAKQQERVIGIDLGSTKICATVRDMSVPERPSPHEASYYEEVRRPATARSLIDQVKSLIARIIDTDNFAHGRPGGIGIAVPGQVDARAGTLKFGPGLGVRNVPFRTALAATYRDVPIRVDNDARCATRCELHLGVGRDFETFVCIFIGTGVGSGIVINRQILFGQNYCAGEIGHTKISNSGPPCSCGQIGCLETFVKGPAIAALAQAKAIDWENRGRATVLTQSGSMIDPFVLGRAVDDGDPAALEVVDEVGEKLGQGIANYLNLVNPGTIVLGGGLMAGFYLHLIESVTRSIQRSAVAEVVNTPIVQSQYADGGAALGASLLFHPAERWPF